MDKEGPVIEVTELSRKDWRKVIPWEIEGMRFDRYFRKPSAVRLFGRYFWYETCNAATRIYGAYRDGTCVGMMAVAFDHEPCRYGSWFTRTFVRVFQGIAKRKYAEESRRYEETNEEMFRETFGDHPPDGTIILLAADPHAQVRGIGTALLNELVRAYAGKTIYLYTDGDCTYQFYEHRGFDRVNSRSIVLEYGGLVIPLECYLYARRL